MRPLLFHPILKRTRWGGRRLGTCLGKRIGEGDDWAESWELADHGDDQTRVAAGPWAGWTLNRLVTQRSVELLGRHAGIRQFPLLFKFLDAHDRLSVQVHPGDESARQFDSGKNGKTEAWVILEAEPESSIYAGLAAGVERPDLEAALSAGRVEECLHRFSARAGDVVFLPAGTVHAIGEGILLAEVQQSSDMTFRLADWGRLGTDGKPRPLHVAEALACINFRQGPVDPLTPRVAPDADHLLEHLVDCAYFVMRRHVSSAPFGIHADERFVVLMVLAGSGALAWDDESIDLVRGRTVLVPAACPAIRVEPAEEICVLETFLP